MGLIAFVYYAIKSTSPTCRQLIVFRYNASQKTLSGMFTHINQEMSTAEQSIYTPKPSKLRCEICGKIFETPEMLSYHMSVEHSQDRRPPIGIS